MSPITAQSPPLTLAEYASQAQQSDRFADDAKGLERLRFGFFGEVGGLLASVKKVSRDQLHQDETLVAAEEIGDALWYLVAIASQLKVSPDELGSQCIKRLRSQFHEAAHFPGSEVSFRQIDGILDAQPNEHQTKRIAHLGELANAAGILSLREDAQLHAEAVPSKAEQLGGLLAKISVVGAAFGLRLEDVARENLLKISSRWPGSNPKHAPLLDDDPQLPEYQKLPRVFRIRFEERGDRTHGHVVLSLNDVYIGDRLTDNSNEPDDYRFHDVFHLAYIAHLGWSPVIRALLKRKRKAKPEVDESQDGARAMIIEEGIATWIFNHAKRRRFYSDVDVGKLDYGLLKQIQNMVTGYEVDQCPLWQWERAILDGFKIFRQLQDLRRGFVNVDMNARTITFEEI